MPIKQYRKNTKMIHLTTKKRNILIIGTLVTILAIGGGYFVYSQRSQDTANTETLTSENDEKINLDPPTEEEQNSANEIKEEIVNRQESVSSQNNGIKDVDVTISSATKDAVYSSVAGVVEEDGTCTAKFVKGSQVISGSSKSIPNVSYTQCAPIKPSSKLSNGNWEITVSYQSSKTQGVSQPYQLEVK